jgi:heat shock protein HtpX
MLSPQFAPNATVSGIPLLYATFLCLSVTFLCLWHESRMTLLHAKPILLWLRFGGLRVFNVSSDGGAWRGDRTGQYVVTGPAPCISLALVRSLPHLEMLQLRRSGASGPAELHLPTNMPAVVLRCSIEVHSLDQKLSRFRRTAHQVANHRSSALAIAAMTLLLAVCGWIVGGTEGVHRALAGSAPRPNGPAISREAMFRWFGARLLRPAELPELFNILVDVCSRARLSRLPDLYCLPAPGDMNAYALGGPGGAAIVLTEGLLRRMTRGEIAGILAHEVAHIRNNDAWTMSWAVALHRAIEWTSLAGLALLRAQHGGTAASRPLAALLSAAPSIAQLLRLALSRTRELDADATALELTGDSQALIAALDKLERHHAGFPALSVTACEDGPMRLLRSHPATSERVGALLSLAY